MRVSAHLPLEELQRLARAIPAKRLWKRYQAVILATRGQDAATIALALQCSVRSVQSWVKQYNDEGPDSLQEGKHTGRPPRISGSELVRFKERVEAGPTPDDGRSTFYGEDLRRILEQEFGVKLCLQAVYDLLHRLGLSSLMPRPIHRKANPGAQEAFKKAPPRRSPPSPRPVPPSGSRSGSLTRRGSGSKAP